MSDEISLKLEERTVTGKAVKKLRRDGQVPAVIHDHGKPSVHVMASYLDMYKAYQKAGKHHPVELKVGDKAYTALIKTAEFEPRKNRLNHVVFGAVKADEKVEAEVPIRPRFDADNEASPAERAGLMVLSNLETVEVEAVPSKLPDFLEYDAEKLVEVGDHATVADLVVPDGVVILTEPEHAIATVYEPSAIAAANDAAGGDAEPEDEVPAEEGDVEATEEGAEAATEGDQPTADKETKSDE
jgi:large subunit ribosomal protein L25